MIKAIETYYNGYRFRSRLEARWAVFFDALGIKYEYEPEGYELSDGSKYLPDFYLPDLKYYVEVKGKSIQLESDLQRIERFVLDSKCAVMILSEVPYDTGAQGLYWFPIMYFQAKSRGRVEACYAFFQPWSGGVGIQDDYAVGCDKRFRYLWYGYGKELPAEKINEILYSRIQAISGAILDDDPSIADFSDLNIIEEALLKARQARFEHGETP